MLDGIVFGRLSNRGGNGGVSANSDALFSRVRETKDRESLSLRLHQDVLRRLRWMLGDYIVVRPEDNGSKWVVERVSGPKQNGMKLSRSGDKSSHHGTTRFSVSMDVLDEIFKDDSRSFTATLCDNDGSRAVFLVD